MVENKTHNKLDLVLLECSSEVLRSELSAQETLDLIATKLN